MQHAYGRKLHRVTEWRRVKRDDELDRQPPDEPRESRGRKRSEDGSDGKSFLGFSAAVIGLFNEKGYCHYEDIQRRHPRQRDARAWREYYPAPVIFDKLAASGFPPAMLACAVAEVIPLNERTRGGRWSQSNMEAETEIQRRLSSDKRKRLKDALKACGHDSATINEAAKECDFNVDWMKEYKTDWPENRDSFGTRPMSDKDMDELKSSELNPLEALMQKEPDETPTNVFKGFHRTVKGTPIQHVKFIGATIDRKMVSYWRNHRQYKKAIPFVKSLLAWPAPRAPYLPEDGKTADNARMANRYFNALLRKKAKQRILSPSE